VLLIDEIGKMECCCGEFTIRRRDDAETILVTRENRDALPQLLAAKLSSRPAT
jgi:nucleoside-triphosphatase THEP1